MPTRGFAWVSALSSGVLVLLVLQVGSASGERGQRALARGAAARMALAPVPPPDSLPPGARELPELRTRTSRTYALPNGTFDAIVSQHSLNYRDAQGAWQPIDNSLVPAGGGGYANKGNAYSAHLPGELSAPVRFSEDGGWVEFRLDGARGSGRVSGNTDSFGGVLPNVDVGYAAGSDFLHETLTLKNPSAPSSFSYQVQTSPGLSAKEDGHSGIDFLDHSGKRLFSFVAPYMQDSSGTPAGLSRAVSLKLAPSASGYEVTLSADKGWLSSPERKWPVTIDPTTGTVFLDCTIAEGHATTNYCPTTYLVVGQDPSGRWRTLDPWTLTGFPPNVQVLNADLALYLFAEQNTTPFSISVHQQTRAHTQSATWNTYDGVNPWTTPGGDFVSTADDSNPSVGGTLNTRVHVYPTKLVQGWLDGTIANDGMVLKASSEPAPNWVEFYSADAANGLTPTLSINYSPRTGEPRQFSFNHFPLTDRVSADVNVANGNLVMNADDLNIDGTGLDLNISRFHNSLAANASSNTHVGNGWDFVYGITNQPPGLSFTADGSAFFFGPSDEPLLFQKNADGTFSSPTAIDATFVKNGDGTYTLSMHKSGESYTFSAAGLVQKHVDPNGNTVSFTDGSCGSQTCITSITDTQGRTTTISYNAAGDASQLADSSGRTYQYVYNASHDLTSFTDPAGKTTNFAYDASHNMTSVTDPLGNTTSFGYDSWRRVTSIVRGPGGPTTTYSYQAADSACPSGSIDKTIVTDPNNHQTTYCFDSNMRATRVIDAKGNAISTTTYNTDSNPLSETDALGHTTTFGYDTTNEKLLFIQSPLEGTSNRTTFAYGSSTLPYVPTSFTNPQGHTWTFAYDASGDLTSQTPSGQQPVTFTYNSNGTMATATDSKGNTTTYSYDAKGNLTGIAPPAPLGAQSITYDSLSRINTVTDGKSQTRAYTYDPLDRTTQIAYTGGPTISFAFDADGNLTSEVDPTGSYTDTYDSLNRLTKETQPQATISYSYDSASNLTGLTDSSGTRTYTYDVDSLLATLLEPGATTAIQFQYDKNQSRTEIDYPNGVSDFLSYDASKRLVSVVGKKPASGTILNAFCYMYANSLGLDTDFRQSVTNVSSTIPGCPTTGTASTTTYNYDSLDRLAKAQTPSTVYQYLYDSAGNMCAKYSGATSISLTSCTQTGTGITNFTVNAANELTNTGYSFDANGNGTATPNVFSSASYNALDQTSTITPSGGPPIAMSYHGLGQANRTAAASVNYVNDQLGLNEQTGSPNTFFTRDSTGATLGERRSGSYYFLFDGMGSVVNVTDSSGNTVDSFTYDPYGAQTCASSCTVFEPIQYAGGYNDNANSTGAQLVKFGERYYDASTGRWTQQDVIDNPLGLTGWNRYDYAGDDPVNSTDRSGLSGCFLGFICPVWGIGGGTHISFNAGPWGTWNLGGSTSSPALFRWLGGCANATILLQCVRGATHG